MRFVSFVMGRGVIHSSTLGPVQFFRVARTYAGRALYWTGFYFIDGLLVDSGPSNIRHEAERLFSGLDIRASVTTHHHEDHCGNNALLADRFGIIPMAHQNAAGKLASPERLQFYRRAAWGSPAPSRSTPLPEHLDTPSFVFHVIHTPGHAEDHVVLHERTRGWLFTGDLYLGPRLRYLRADENVHALMNSLRRAIALEPAVLFCNHRGPVVRGAGALRQKLAALEDMEGRVRELHGTGLSPNAIARALPGRDLLWRAWTAGHFSKLNFVKAFLQEPTAAAR